MTAPITAFGVAATSMMLTAAAHAQSSLDLYGSLDAGVTLISNSGGHRTAVMDTGLIMPNLIGVKGSEDLVGRTKAIFQIEGQYEVNSGMSDGNALRQSWIGLTDTRYGTLTLGNQYDFMFSSLSAQRYGEWLRYVSMTNFREGPFSGIGIPNGPSPAFDFDGTAGSSRMANAVKYQSNPIEGFTFGGMYGFGNVSGNVSNQNAFSFGADYQWSSGSIDIAYTLTRYAAIDNGEKGIRQYGAGSHWDLSAGIVDLLYTNTQNTFSHAAIDVLEVGLLIKQSKAVHWYLSYQYMKGNSVLQNNHAHQLTETFDDGFSRRTDVYVTIACQRATVSADTESAWIQAATSPSSSANQSTVRLGMRHTF